MKTAWTPGPWITVEISPTVIARGIFDTPRGASIAHVYREADRKLIAAAPELYAALDQLLHEAIEAGFDTATDYGWPKSIAAARAALAKARGEGGE